MELVEAGPAAQAPAAERAAFAEWAAFARLVAVVDDGGLDHLDDPSVERCICGAARRLLDA